MEANPISELTLGVQFLLAAIIYVITCFPITKILAKAGEKEWKGWVPILNEFCMYKISWSTAVFWLMILLGLVYGFSSTALEMSTDIVSEIIYVIIVILYVVFSYKLSKVFNHGIGFAIGLIFLPVIFYYIIVFGNSEYVGKE